MPRNPGKAHTRGQMGMAARCLIMLAMLTIALHSAQAQQAGVRSELSSSTITLDETVVLTVTAVGVDEELDASALDRDFDVLGRSSSREIRTISDANNRIVTTSVVTWALELMPRKTGVFSVPSVKVGDMSTQLLTLTVNDVPQGAKRDIFVEASLDTQQPWVQSQVIMTVSVFQAIDIVDGGLDEPSGANLVVERVGEDARSRQLRDGREYTVTERRFALFPQKSGVLKIDPVTLSVTIPADSNRSRGFFSPTRKLTRRTLPMRLDVRKRPDGINSWWLPASAVQLQSQWVTPPDEARVDTPLTRSIVLRVEGVQDAQLPDIPVPAIDGISLYSEEPQRAMGVSSRGLVAEQKINWALIPQRSGTIVLPEVRIEWFNTNTGLTETALLPEERITVPANEANASLTNAGNANSGSPESANAPDSPGFQGLDSTALQG
ncbi:MAG: BatD family protein, partial [Granulosicoccus sp.]